MKTTYKLSIANTAITGTAQAILASQEALGNLDMIAAGLAEIASGRGNGFAYIGFSPTETDFNLELLDDHRARDLYNAFRTLSDTPRAALRDATNRFIAITHNNIEDANKRFALSQLSAFINSI